MFENVRIIFKHLVFYLTLFNSICIPVANSIECGIVPNVPNRVNSKYSSFPWNVAIFEVNKDDRVHICGGTIITEYLVVSAAHCYHDESSGLMNDPSNYEIVVSKVTRKYTAQDNDDTQAYKIRTIHSQNYEGWNNKYANDIVVLETHDKIILKNTVTPACLEWTKQNQLVIRSGVVGKGVSWGALNNSESYDVDLVYSSNEKCLRATPDDFKPYITSDKFCIENVTDEFIRTTDAGGGFFLYTNTGYYLMGVLSIHLNGDNFFIIAVTNISYHLNWIKNVQSNIENRIVQTLTASGGCKLPPNTPGRKYSVLCTRNGVEQMCPVLPGVLVPLYTSLKISCDSGYTYQTEDSSPVCVNGVWKPIIANCASVCKNLVPSNVKLTCIYGEKDISCNSTMKTGTIVYPECFPAYKAQGGNPGYREIICQENGEWNNVLFKCEPECGIQYKKTVTLIQGGRNESYGDSPWHVAVYDISSGIPGTYSLICGGTIISAYLIVSAAHCFSSREEGIRRNAVDYEIVVSKVKRNYTIIDNADTQAYKIRAIHFSSRGYYGLKTKHVHDIAILEVVTKIDLKPTVRTACVQWTRWNRFSVPDGTPGKVVGWGIDDSDNPRGSDTLLAADLPYVSYDKCVKVSTPTFTQFVTPDKFCAGDINGGSTVTTGDSGGGLMFKIDSLYYVCGIVSIKEIGSRLAAFTDVSEHLQWINSVKNDVERRILRQETYIPFRES